MSESFFIFGFGGFNHKAFWDGPADCWGVIVVVDKAFADVSFINIMFMEEVGFEDKFVADLVVFVCDDREVIL